jgi:hypothetical protein
LLEVGGDVVQHDVALGLVGRDDQQFAALASYQRAVLSQCRDVGSQHADGAALAAAPANHGNEFLDHAVGLALAAGQLLEHGALVIS